MTSTILLTANILLAVLTTLTDGEEFGYTGENGPHSWPGICKSGKEQSPIDIDSGKSVRKYFEDLVLLNYDTPTSVNVTYNGHTVRLDVEQPCSLTAVAGGLTGAYVLDHIHFHWPSEHTINGIRFPLEVHLVHYDSKHRNLKTAVKKENGIAVLGILFQESGVDNFDLEPFITRISHERTSVRHSEKVIPKKIVPKDITRFYRYEGSLTTPGCDETVLWTVFPHTEPVSKRQLEKFQALPTKSGQKLTFNNRPIQPLNDRFIHERDSLSGQGQKSLDNRYMITVFILLIIVKF